MGIRTAAKGAGVGVSVLAAAMILASGALADPPSPDVPVPPPDTANQAAAPPEGVPHLSSPDNPPPGTSDTPVPGMDGDGEAYAKEIWHAIREHDITWRQGLFLLSQRPMNANARPPAGLATGPQQTAPSQAAAPPEPPPAQPAPAPAAPAPPAT
jgi:hypothetical protein